MKPESPDDRIAKKTELRENGCLIWTGRQNDHPVLTVEGRPVVVRRYMWKKHKGTEMPPRIKMTCKQEGCVAPEHMRVMERVDYQTRAKPTERASREVGAHAKLTRADVLAIRRLHAEGVSQGQLAKTYGVKQPTIWLIVRRITWANVPDEAVPT